MGRTLEFFRLEPAMSTCRDIDWLFHGRHFFDHEIIVL
ncbi:hypothetical protein AWB81_07991 [Caballeronia arationis]|nr:hypothetical protein AWB81_07991 [Caballeronia arationis]